MLVEFVCRCARLQRLPSLRATIVVIQAITVCGCGNKAPQPDGATPAPANTAARGPLTDAQVAANNRAVALMGQFEYAKAFSVFEALSQERPDELNIKFNLAIAALNRDQNGNLALPLLAGVLEADPDHLAARYCTGLLLQYAGAFEEAIPHLQRVANADPNDAYALYFLAFCLERSSPEKALEIYQKVNQLDPYLQSAYYRVAQLSRLQRKDDQAKEALAAFQKLTVNPQARAAEVKYTRMGSKAEVIELPIEPVKTVSTSQASQFHADPQVLLPRSGYAWAAEPHGRAVSITAADINGDGIGDLFFADAVTGNATVRNAVLLGQSDGSFKLDATHPLATSPDVRAALWGDYDNDGFVDVYFCRKGENQLWRQHSPGQWRDATAETRTGGGNFDSVDGAIFDADHDGDLDVFVVNADGPNELFNNDRTGQFRPLAKEMGIAGDGRPSRAVLAVDLDHDRDLDVIIVKQKPPHEVFLNDRLWKYQPAHGLGAVQSADLHALVAGDRDTDGQVELYGSGPDGLVRFSVSRSGHWEKTIVEATPAANSGIRGQLALVDVNADGTPEFLLAGTNGLMAIDSTDPQLVRGDYGDSKNVIGWTTFAGGPKKGLAAVGLSSEKGPLLWESPSDPTRFLSIAFTGKREEGGKYEPGKMRSNRSGIGITAAVRVGSRWTSRVGLREHSGPGQSLQPWLVGLGGADGADFIRIDWSDGVFQTELELAADKHHEIAEMQRMPSSCPVLFAWDGTRYRFVTDILGVGGLGYLVAPGQYAPTDPTESLLLAEASIAPRNGRYEIKLTEPAEELTYLDSAKLLAYDLPPGWSMTLDERLGTGDPAPTGEPRFYRRWIAPKTATNDRGEVVTDAISKADLQAAPPGQLDARFIGRTTRHHAITLTFGEPIDRGDGELMLVADGWIEFPYSQTAFAAWQAGATYDAPTIEARGSDGRWRTVLKQFGYPGGMPRQMSVPLAKLPKETVELRLTTNLEVYWDRLMVAYAEPCPQVRRHELALASANLRHIGFPGRDVGKQGAPDFDYAVRWPIADARYPAGNYTRFGSVDELVSRTDDALAIFGPGEEIHFEFIAPRQPAESGWSRRIVLESVGWCKDMDLFTKDGETVDPVPSRRKTDRASGRLHQVYNTRFQSGP